MPAPINVRFTEEMAADLLASLQEITKTHAAWGPLTCWRPVNALATYLKAVLDARNVDNDSPLTGWTVRDMPAALKEIARTPPAAPMGALATRIKTELDARSAEIAAVRPDSIHTHQTGN
jgi:hypothetical protein